MKKALGGWIFHFSRAP